jgi:hypothetical protein
MTKLGIAGAVIVILAIAVIIGIVVNRQHQAAAQVAAGESAIPTSAQTQQFAQTLQSMPPSQRKDYLTKHSQEFNAILEDPGSPEGQQVMQALKQK